jgi:tetratricopeptide (TPR) repeat protein
MPIATAPRRSSGTTSSAKPSSLIDLTRSVLAEYAERPGEAQAWQKLVGVRRSAAETVAALPPGRKDGPELTAALELLREFNGCGAADYPVSPDDLALVREYSRRGWPGLLAAMLLVPAWQWPGAPRLDDVPAWLWPVYTAYVFYTPQGFCAPGQAGAYAAHYLRRLEELSRLAEANRGSAAVRMAISIYQKHGSCIPLYFAPESLRRHYELRGRILTLAFGLGRQEEPVAFPRVDRRLRIGFVNRHFSSQTETYTTLPTFEQLDPERFEVILFTHQFSGTALEEYARSRVADLRLLPPELEGQVQMLRDAVLDVLVFGTNVTALCNEVTRLALFRVAPLQIVNNSSCTTSGLPEIDLYVSGSLTESPEAPEHFSERLGLLPGPAHAFNYEADRQEPATQWTRAALGLPEDCLVFVTAANYYKIMPEMQEAWARLLAAVPGSRLLVHPFNPNWSSSYPIKRFCAGFDRVLAVHGVATERLVVSTLRFPSRTDVRSLLGVGDIYLDTFPFAGVNSLVDPLEAGVPVAVWEGRTFRSRMGGGLLRALGLDELIAHDGPAYHELVLRLAADRDWREALRRRIKDQMIRQPIFLDPLAASDAFGALVETAYDELCQRGREAFRRERTPIVAGTAGDPKTALESASSLFTMGLVAEAANEARRILASQPAHPAARHLMAAALLRQGRGGRALTYLLGAVRQAGNSAALWHDLAVALHHNGRPAESMQALQLCLRLDGARLESWLMLGEWAAEAGDAEEARKAADFAQRLAPNDARVSALTARAAAA